MAALVGDTSGADTMTLDQLWVPGRGARQPALRRGSPASFLLLSPAGGGVVDPSSTRLVSVFVNGFDVKGDS